MKAVKKLLAIILSICIIFSLTAFFASAEEAVDYEITVSEARAVTLDKENPEKVLRIELVLAVDDEETTDFIYDTVDLESEIMISEFSYAYRRAVIDATVGNDVSDETVIRLCEEAKIAKAVPVSLQGNVLTADVYSLDGKSGADMVEVDFTGFDDLDSKAFVFKLPERMFSDSETGDNSEEIYARADVNGLTVVEVETPYLIRAYFGDDAVFSLTVLLVLPFLPISAITFMIRYQKVCDIYGFNIYDEVRALLNVIISQLKQNL